MVMNDDLSYCRAFEYIVCISLQSIPGGSDFWSTVHGSEISLSHILSNALDSYTKFKIPSHDDEPLWHLRQWLTSTHSIPCPSRSAAEPTFHSANPITMWTFFIPCISRLLQGTWAGYQRTFPNQKGERLMYPYFRSVKTVKHSGLGAHFMYNLRSPYAKEENSQVSWGIQSFIELVMSRNERCLLCEETKWRFSAEQMMLLSVECWTAWCGNKKDLWILNRLRILIDVQPSVLRIGVWMDLVPQSPSFLPVECRFVAWLCVRWLTLS